MVLGVSFYCCGEKVARRAIQVTVFHRKQRKERECGPKAGFLLFLLLFSHLGLLALGMLPLPFRAGLPLHLILSGNALTDTPRGMPQHSPIRF
jgi:hypothetical protein